MFLTLKPLPLLPIAGLPIALSQLLFSMPTYLLLTSYFLLLTSYFLLLIYAIYIQRINYDRELRV